MPTFQVKRGLFANLPASALTGEPIWTTDTHQFYLGTGASLHEIGAGGSLLGTLGVTEVPSGDVDGVNDTFTISQTPSPTTGLLLFRNGLLQEYTTDFTLSGTTITFVAAPLVGDTLFADYPAYQVAPNETPGGDVDGVNTTFTLANAPLSLLALRLFRDGLLQTPTTDFTLSGSTITMTAAPLTGDVLLATYLY